MQIPMQQHPEEIKLLPEEILNHVYIDDFWGGKTKVRTYSLGKHLKEQQVRLLFYQPSEKYSVFMFMVFNTITQERGGIEVSYNDNKITRKSYIFVRKTRYDMQTLLQSQGLQDVIKPNDEILILKSFDCLEKIRFTDISAYQFANLNTDENPNVQNDFVIVN